jgi:hypothetical protein
MKQAQLIFEKMLVVVVVVVVVAVMLVMVEALGAVIRASLVVEVCL